MKDTRNNYFDPPHSADPNPIDTSVGSNKYDSDLDRITEEELVPDIVERLTVRYDIDYNNSVSNRTRKKFIIPGINKIGVIRMLKQLFALIPRVTENEDYTDMIRHTNVVVVPIVKGDTSVTVYGESTWTITRAYLSSTMTDMTPNADTGSAALVKDDNNYSYTPTIPFKQDDELVVYYRTPQEER